MSMKFPLGEMTVGDILDRGLKLFTARFFTLFTIYLIVQAPLLVVQVIITPDLIDGHEPTNVQSQLRLLGNTAGLALLSILLNIIAMGATLHVVSQEYIGE